MGNFPRFDLKKHVTRWRQALSATGRLARRRPDELEIQLRSTTDSLSSSGLTEDEAQLIAVKRLGEAVASRHETAKAAGAAKWRQPVFWMAVGLLGAPVWATILALGSLIAATRLELRWLSGVNLAIGLATSLPLVWLLLSGRLEGALDTLARRLENPHLRCALIIGLVSAACAYAPAISWWQTRLLNQQLVAAGQALRPAVPGIAFYLTGMLWPIALGICLWRLAAGRGTTNSGQDRGLAGTLSRRFPMAPELPTEAVPFDLESGLTHWRKELLARETVSTECVRELEGHLRDTFAEQSRHGLPPAEAFKTALERLGDTAMLAAEFDKENPAAKWRHRLFWMAAGIFGSRLLLSFLGLVFMSSDFLLSRFILSGAPHNNFPLTARVGELAMLGIGYLLLQGRLEPLANRMAPWLRRRAAVGLLVMVLPVTNWAAFSVFYYCMRTIQGGLPIHGVAGFFQAVAPSVFFLGSMLLLPAWLIFLAPLPRAKLKS